MLPIFKKRKMPVNEVQEEQRTIKLAPEKRVRMEEKVTVVDGVEKKREYDIFFKAETREEKDFFITVSPKERELLLLELLRRTELDSVMHYLYLIHKEKHDMANMKSMALNGLMDLLAGKGMTVKVGAEEDKEE